MQHRHDRASVGYMASEQVTERCSQPIVTTRRRSVSGQQPQFVLHSADRHSGDQLDPSLSSLQSSEAESVQTIGFHNRYSAYIIGSEPGSLRLGNIREDQSVWSLKLPESLRASSAIHISETEPTRVQIRLERYRVSRQAAPQQSL